MIPVDRAAGRISQLLEAGDTVAIVADHHARSRGVPVTFLGLPTLAMKSVALLAQHYSATVAVAGIRRLKDQFRFEIEVSDVFGCKDWEPAADPIAYITSRYLRGLERIILRDPSQYLWVHARWGEESARRLTAINP
jgi:KDO2-lipid IV(A) lauroyltransferase